MAFEDDLGYDASQPRAQEYALNASGLISRTVSLWSRKFIQYIIIVGVISAASTVLSFVLLFSLFGLIGTLGADPISVLVGFFFDPLSNPSLLFLSVGFAIVVFILNAIIYGAAIKFTLDEYGGTGGDVAASFSRSSKRVLNIVIVQLILGLVVAIILTPASILTLRAMEMIDITDPFNPIFPPGSIELLMSALGLFLIGGIFLIYMQVRFIPTLAIVIDTDLSAFESLKKSWELTSGHFFHVFGSIILLNIVIIILDLIVSTFVTFTRLPDSNLLVIQSVVAALLFSPLTYIFTSVLYRDLSSRRGSSTLDELMI